MKQKNHQENGNPFSTRYSVKLRKPLQNNEPSLTKQSFKDEVDANNILRKYTETGVLPSSNRGSPLYSDFSNVPSYQESLNTVMKAEEQFAGLPAIVRNRFHNDPGEFLAFATNPDNSKELVKLGLAFEKENAPIITEDIPKTVSKKESKAKPDTELS